MGKACGTCYWKCLPCLFTTLSCIIILTHDFLFRHQHFANALKSNCNFCLLFCFQQLSTPPRAKRAVYVLIAGTAAFACSVASTSSCHFLNITYPNTIIDTPSGASIDFAAATFRIGLFRSQSIANYVVDTNFRPVPANEVASWPDNYPLSCSTWWQSNRANFDSAWKAARGLSICADLFTGIAMMICIFMTIASVPDAVIKMASALFLLGFVMECLVFVAFLSNICSSGCEFDKGARAAVAAVVFAFIAGIVATMIPSYSAEEVRSAASYVTPGRVTAETTVSSDGTKLRTNTTASADGSPIGSHWTSAWKSWLFQLTVSNVTFGNLSWGEGNSREARRRGRTWSNGKSPRVILSEHRTALLLWSWGWEQYITECYYFQTFELRICFAGCFLWEYHNGLYYCKLFTYTIY